MLSLLLSHPGAGGTVDSAALVAAAGNPHSPGGLCALEASLKSRTDCQVTSEVVSALLASGADRERKLDLVVEAAWRTGGLETVIEDDGHLAAACVGRSRGRSGERQRLAARLLLLGCGRRRGGEALRAAEDWKDAGAVETLLAAGCRPTCKPKSSSPRSLKFLSRTSWIASDRSVRRKDLAEARLKLGLPGDLSDYLGLVEI